MKFAPIVPIPMLDDVRGSNYHLVLAHLLGEPIYENFYRDLNEFKILDNGAAEGSLVSMGALIECAVRINADEVCAPDTIGDADASRRQLMHFTHAVQDMDPPLKIMAALQATTWYEFAGSLDLALKFNVTSVALPRALAKTMGPTARLIAAEQVRKWDHRIPIHAFGCTDHVSEAKDLAKQGIVRGLDTAAPVVLGLQGFDLWEDIDTKRADIPAFWKRQSIPMVEANLRMFREWCEGA